LKVLNFWVIVGLIGIHNSLGMIKVDDRGVDRHSACVRVSRLDRSINQLVTSLAMTSLFLLGVTGWVIDGGFTAAEFGQLSDYNRYSRSIQLLQLYIV